jgi:cyclophilin family peptidyl-prolyl cis-trans isomerase
MSIPSSRSNLRSRRDRPAAVETAAGEPETYRLPDAAALITLAVIIGLLTLLGYGVAQAVKVKPTGAFANCKTQAQLAPHLYAGPPARCIDVDKIYIAHLHTTRGTIGITMVAKDAPETVNNFVVLSANGFYNGLGFWRVEGWILQGGDPSGDGTGGPGYTLHDEPSKSSWTVASVGMARNPGGGVNGSQFFVLKDSWPGGGPGSTVYNKFGTVIDGYDLIAQFNASDRILTVDLRVQ